MRFLLAAAFFAATFGNLTFGHLTSGHRANAPTTIRLPVVLLEYSLVMPATGELDPNIKLQTDHAEALMSPTVVVRRALNIYGKALENLYRSWNLPPGTPTFIFGHGGNDASGQHFLAGAFRTRIDVMIPLRNGMGDPSGRSSPVWVCGCHSGAAIASPLEPTGASSLAAQESAMDNPGYSNASDRFAEPLLEALSNTQVFDKWDVNQDEFLSPKELARYFKHRLQRPVTTEITNTFVMSSLPCELEAANVRSECGLSEVVAFGKLSEIGMKYGRENVKVTTSNRYNIRYTYTANVVYTNGQVGPANYTVNEIYTHAEEKLKCEQLLAGKTIVACEIVAKGRGWTVQVTEKGICGFRNTNHYQTWDNHGIVAGFYLRRSEVNLQKLPKVKGFLNHLVVQAKARAMISEGGDRPFK